MTQQEFEHIYSSIREKLTRLARQFGKASGVSIDAEDIAQEALITLWKLSQQGYPIQNPEGLLVKITKVSCISRMRKQQLKTCAIESDDYAGSDSSDERVEKLDETTIKNMLYECLTKTEREYMELRTNEGMSLDEIAEKTGKGKPGIYTAISKAKKKLEEQLKKLGYVR